MTDMFKPLPGAKDGSATRASEQDPWRVIVPVPDAAPAAPVEHPKRGAPSVTWTYRDAEGRLLGYVMRFDPPAGKEFLPLILYRNADTGVEDWRWKSWPPPRPLYGLDRLAQRPGAPVVVCEGEKSADAAAKLLPDYVAVTSPNGALSAGKADWSPLARRPVVIWPDADKSGRKYADAAARALARIARSIDVVEPPPEVAEGWDAANALAEGWDRERVETFMDVRARSRPTLAANSKIVKLDQDSSKRAARRAARQPNAELGTSATASGGADSPWRDILIGGNKQKPQVCLENAASFFFEHPECKGRIALDIFANRIVLRDSTPWTICPGGRPLEPGDIRHARRWLEREGLNASDELTAQALAAAADLQKINPVVDYLYALKWDGVPRLSTWLTTYFGAPDTPYVRAIGRAWLVSGVARISSPGCKVDHVLIAEGNQGLLKSTAFAQLVPNPEWFTDDVPDIRDKDAQMALSGAWIVELSELEAIQRADVARVKAFISRQVDRFRPPYGRMIEARPRTCIFCGSVNMDTYLRDETGGRRFWPFKTGKIDLDGLAAARDQLWAEATCAYHGGEKWWLTDPGLVETAKEEQAARLEPDEWSASIARYIEEKSSVSIGEVLRDLLGLAERDWDQLAQKRVGRSLRALGWTRQKKRADGWKWRFYPPANDQPPASSGGGGEGQDEWES